MHSGTSADILKICHIFWPYLRYILTCFRTNTPALHLQFWYVICDIFRVLPTSSDIHSKKSPENIRGYQTCILTHSYITRHLYEPDWRIWRLQDPEFWPGRAGSFELRPWPKSVAAAKEFSNLRPSDGKLIKHSPPNFKPRMPNWEHKIAWPDLSLSLKLQNLIQNWAGAGRKPSTTKLNCQGSPGSANVHPQSCA